MNTNESQQPSKASTAATGSATQSTEQQCVAVVGDGQLARMMHTEAIELGIRTRLLAGSPDASAAQVVGDVQLGQYTELEALRTVASGASAVTFDHEHVPQDHLRALLAEGVNVQPGPDSLMYAQDKLLMRKRLREIGAPVPPFAAIASADDAAAFFDAVAGEVCLKARTGGYDGHGVWFPATAEETRNLVSRLLGGGVQLMAEKRLALEQELSAMVARTPSGRTQPWPVVESVQRDGICTEAIAPAPSVADHVRKEAEQLACTVAEELGVTGVLAVELFLVSDDNGQPELFVNELAMRPHNTGHWTQNGCVTSQFEQHLRAVLDWPLGSTRLLAPATAMANVLGAKEEPEQSVEARRIEVLRRFPEAKIHLYGKQARPGRKLGHVNVSGDDPQLVRKQARLAAGYLANGRWADSAEHEASSGA